ncbi:hypothetical protein [Haloglycomyces albus]|uniref:hypothetical protein n=1 Tax=Haloglycomyces albus TaxID=526067 RepID=UPI00046D5DB9|nr:hypothetical protein [Haloglycomyces albus]
MPVNYLPTDAVVIGTIEHDRHHWHAHLDVTGKTVYLLPVNTRTNDGLRGRATSCLEPEGEKESTPERECPPDAIAYCHEWRRPNVVLYNERLYTRARRSTTWLPELTDKIAWTVRPYLNQPD